MEGRNIKDGLFGWYEKKAMKKIESLPFSKQGSCKLIYIALCSISAKNGNTPHIRAYKREIADFASVSEKTVQRYLPELESIGIIEVDDTGRTRGGLWEKMSIHLLSNNSPMDTESIARDMKSIAKDTESKAMDSSMDTESAYIKKERNIKNNIKKISKKNPSFAHPIVQNLWKTLTEECDRFQLQNEVNPQLFPDVYEMFAGKINIGEAIRDCIFYHKERNPRKSIKTLTIKNWMKNSVKWNKDKERRDQTRRQDVSDSIGIERSSVPKSIINQFAQKMSME